ncbi:MAG: hypothetical protein F2555_02180 [Actinobacteria bacterium]|uniref:Unannotated protein n=1 Tax=freshwater metagenome TaxID=449393 RepID=A0A6J6DS98_9ZZZZ|nr:hypothetical protein [Actinomycetota bacterium]
MARTEISDHQKEVLAWKIMGEALRFIDQDLVFADLHPGGGQYDCLSLISRESEIVLMLNRAGSSAAGKTDHVEDIWETAIKENARAAAMYILSELGIDMYDEKDKDIDNSDQVLTCKRMARWVQSQSEKIGKPICCWIDDTYYVGQAKTFLEQVKIPPNWIAQEPPYKGTDWSAWLFALTMGDKVVAMVNMKTGEAINRDGTPMQDWYKKSAVAKKIAMKKPEVISFPEEVPSDEVLSYFRKVGRFDGYKVFGENLASVAESVSEHWRKTGDLPRDIEQIKGALFFEWRRAHHTGQYPEGEELRFIQLLATEIDKQPK